MEGFSSRIKELRRMKNITQAQLADIIGLGASAVGKYENNQAAFPRVEELAKMADYFDVSIDYLVKGTPAANGSIENVINGSVSNSPFIQGNHGGVVVSGDGKTPLSAEAVELLRIYSVLDGKGRLKLLNCAADLEEAIGK